MSTEDLLFHMTDTACVRAWEDEGWGPYHKRLLTMCTKIDFPGKRKRNQMTNIDRIIKHLETTGSISIREAMDDYNMSGGTLTKIISDLKRDGHEIHREWGTHPITGQRYARYRYTFPAVRLAA